MPKVSSKKFFAEQTAHSRVKADIVYKYVLAWAAIVLNAKFNKAGRAAYIDLFSGPGSYDDGARSTPLLIAEAVSQKTQLAQGVQMYFNDINPSLTNSLRQEIGGLANISNLRHEPSYSSEPATIQLIDRLGLSIEVPQFYFLDQFGWADIKPDLIQRIFKNHKCDCAFFLRTPRVIAAVTNPNSRESMEALFGAVGLESLKRTFQERPREKELVVLEHLKESMKNAGAPYFQPFPFRLSAGNSPRQHLVYLGKHSKGLELMKDVMDRSSTMHHGGVPLMGYTDGPVQHSLFNPDPIPGLQNELLEFFSGRTATVGEIFEEHHVTNECFLLRNYQEALRRLESADCVRADPHSSQRPTRNGVVTMSELVTVTFPERKTQ